MSDSTSTVIGQLLSSAATGKVIGQLGGALVMQDVDAAATVTIGEEVFTAGIELGGGIRSPYPKGLLIGRVVDVKRDPNEVVQTVYLEPAAPLDSPRVPARHHGLRGRHHRAYRDRGAVHADRRRHTARLGPAVRLRGPDRRPTRRP